MKIAVTGAGGMVGREVVEAMAPHEVLAWDHKTLDVTDRNAVLGAVTASAPSAIVHCAAWTDVDGCERDRDRAFAVNALAPRWIMDAARRVGAHVVLVSTDYVFDGSKDGAYDEWDTPDPQSVYGQSKLAGEFEMDLECAVVRTSWISGRYGNNLVKTVLRMAADGGKLRFVDDQRASPTIASDLATMLRTFVVERLSGTWHVTNQGVASRYDIARMVLELSGDDPNRVKPITISDLKPPPPAPRPANSVLANKALQLAGRDLLPDYRDSLAQLLQTIERR